MKKRTQQAIAKGFAVIVVLVMILQVLLPLFNSGALTQNAARATASTSPATK